MQILDEQKQILRFAQDDKLAVSEMAIAWPG